VWFPFDMSIVLCSRVCHAQMFRNVILALLLLAGPAAANRVPTVDFTLGHSKLGSNPSPEVLKVFEGLDYESIALASILLWQ